MAGRERTLTVLISSTLLALGVSGSGVRADAFCSRLRTVIGNAGRGFAAIRGAQLAAAPDDGGGDDAIRYAATLRLPGAAACGVDLDRSDGDPIPPIYLCWFAPVPSDGTAVGRINGLVTACIGPEPDGRDAIHQADVVAADVQRKTFVLSITGGRDQLVVLAISGK